MVRSHMSFRAKRELLAQVARRYQQAPPEQKSLILGECQVVCVTGIPGLPTSETAPRTGSPTGFECAPSCRSAPSRSW